MSVEQIETRFMANLFKKSKERTTDLKFLSIFSDNTKVQYSKIINGGLGYALFTFFCTILLIWSGEAFWYVGPWILLLFIAGSGIVVMYILPYNDTNVLNAVITLAKFQYSERSRTRSSEDAVIESHGIKSVSKKKGIIQFDNGDYGVLIKVVGRLSVSSLPVVVSHNASARLKHLISRPASSTETLFITVSHSDLSSQNEYYLSKIENSDTSDIKSAWRALLATLNLQYLKDDIELRDRSIEQHLILRDISLDALNKTIQRFKQSMASGYLSRASVVTDYKDVLKFISKITLSEDYELNDNTVTHFSPSFIERNGKFCSVLRLRVRPGSNRRLSFSDVSDIIPVSVIPGAELRMIVKDAIVPADEKRRLIKTNAAGQKRLIDNIQTEGSDEDNTQADRIVYEADTQDYDEYERILDSSEPVIGFEILLHITANSMEIIDDQIETLNIILSKSGGGSNDYGGLSWVSDAGDQPQRFASIFSRLIPSGNCMTSTASVYSKMDFAISEGLIDPQGIPVGNDIMSLTFSTSFADFDKSIKKLAIVSAGKSSHCAAYSDSDNTAEDPTLSSVMSQAAANHIVMNGHRAHHLVLNDFDYLREGMFYTPSDKAGFAEVFDVSKVTINPLQGFGEIEDVVSVFNRLKNRVVNIFNILEDLNLTQEDKAIILAATERFYFNQSLWTADAAQYPARTHIVNIQSPETYPTLGRMIDSFSALSRSASESNRELKADRIDTLHSILSSALSSNLNILGRTTSIDQTDALHTFYSFENVPTLQMKQIQYLNLIEYVLWTAKTGDVIVVHGAESLYLATAQMTLDAIKSAMRRGVRFIFSFDTIVAIDEPVGEMLDIFKMKGMYYTDLDDGVDMFMMGSCQESEKELLEKAMNQPLSDIVSTRLTSRDPLQILIHRREGSVNNFVYAMPII